jgi:hypothetical protein
MRRYPRPLMRRTERRLFMSAVTNLRRVWMISITLRNMTLHSILTVSYLIMRAKTLLAH